MNWSIANTDRLFIGGRTGDVLALQIRAWVFGRVFSFDFGTYRAARKGDGQQ